MYITNIHINRKRFKTLLIIGVILLGSIGTPFYFYFIKYNHAALSTKPEEWNLFSQYVGGVVGPIISFWSLIITAWIAYEFNSYQKRQQANADKAETQHITIEMFKQFRSQQMVSSRDNAWSVKKKWDANPTYRDHFIECMVTEQECTAGAGVAVEKKEIQGVYDLFAFYNMLSLYVDNSDTLKRLNYFYYGWWRNFLKEVAKKYDEKKKALIFVENDSNREFREEFIKNISFTIIIDRLDENCGFTHFLGLEKNSNFDFYPPVTSNSNGTK